MHVNDFENFIYLQHDQKLAFNVLIKNLKKNTDIIVTMREGFVTIVYDVI